VIALDIISDPVCPWCYIGAAHLFRAIEEQEPPPFAIRWRPFQLNPDMPPEGMDRRAYLDAKFGGPDNARRVYARVEEAAAKAGLAIDFGNIPRAPNTLDAHRLIRWAEGAGVQTPVKMALFRRYFETCEDISDPAVLRAIADEAGMDGAKVAHDLAAGTDRAETRAEADAAQQMGVSGVPAFILGGRYMLSGAQPPETWTKVIAELEHLATTDPSD
jgi:predicted DsbA family dithiol-disulfide isomerase